MKDLVLKGQRVAIIATDGVEKVELTLPRLALEEAGADTMLIAPKPEIQSMKHDQRDERFQADMTLADAHPDEFDAVLLPGGALNADKLRMETAAREFVQHIDQSGKPIAAICHARGSWSRPSSSRVAGSRATTRCRTTSPAPVACGRTARSLSTATGSPAGSPMTSRRLIAR